MSKKAVTKAPKVAKTKSAKKDTTGEKKKRRTKKHKDPNAPKRGKSPYIFYSNSRREPLKKEQPNLNHKDIISVLSKEWNALSESARVPFAKMAEVDKARYNKEKEAYKKKQTK